MKTRTALTTPDPMSRYWTLGQVKTYTTRSRTRIYGDATFPRPIRIGPNTSVWIASEVRAWCDQREVEAGRVAA